MERDYAPRKIRIFVSEFQSTSSVWSSTGSNKFVDTDLVISIHELRVELDVDKGPYFCLSRISIHELRVELDQSRFRQRPSAL